jgi:hypothetical protein
MLVLIALDSASIKIKYSTKPSIALITNHPGLLFSFLIIKLEFRFVMELKSSKDITNLLLPILFFLLSSITPYIILVQTLKSTPLFKVRYISPFSNIQSREPGNLDLPRRIAGWLPSRTQLLDGVRIPR